MKTKTPLAALLALALGPLAPLPPLHAADSPALAEARAELLEAYQRGQRDSDNNVKQLREKIAALEYIASAKAGTPAAEPVPPKLINVDFPGGTFASLLAAINKDGASFNVVGEKADLALELPPLTLRNADAPSLAGALGTLLMQRGYALQPGGGVARGQLPVYALRKLAPYENNRTTTQFQSFQLAPYLEQQSVDDIVGAIRAAWDLDPARDPAMLRIKFHPPTGLLLVSTPIDGVNVVQIVLQQLRRTDRPPEVKTTPAPAKK